MQIFQHPTAHIAAIALMMAALAGCSSTPKVELPDPKDVPREKWSDALLYLDAMGIEGMRDVPKEMVESSLSQSHPGSGSPNAVDAAAVGLGAMSPAGGMSSGASLGIGFGLMLLGSGPVQPVQVTQVAAWVPSDLASSPEEAVRIVETMYNEAREKVFEKKLPQDISLTKYPAASGLSFDKKFPAKENLVLFTAAPSASPSFINAPESYGPIFIRDHKLSTEATLNAKGFMNMQGKWDNMLAISAALPEWFIIYDTAKSFSKDKKLPPAVFRNGNPNYFVGK